MFSFTELPSYGAERLCSNLTLREFFFCLSARGEVLNTSKGGALNGPAIRPTEISSLIFAIAT